MSEKITYLLYDYEDLNILLNSKVKIYKIVPLNVKIYNEVKKNFSDSNVKIHYINDDSKKKIIEEAHDIESIFLKEVNKIKDIKDSTKFNLIYHFSVLNKTIFSYWYAIPDAENWGIINNNKIKSTSNKQEAIYYLLISFLDKSQSIFDLRHYKSKPNFIFRFINNITLFFLKNKKIIWTTVPSKKLLNLIKEAKKVNKNIFSISFFYSNHNNLIYKLLFAIFQIITIIFGKNVFHVRIFPITNTYFHTNSRLIFIKEFKNIKLKYLKDLIINYLEIILIRSETLSNYSSNIIKKLNTSTFLGDHMRSIDGSTIANIYKNNNQRSILISHGSHTIQNDFYSNYASDYMSMGLLYSPFATSIVCQSPSASEVIKRKKIQSKVIYTVPLMWSSKKIVKKNKYLDKFVILHASTCKLMHARPWAYEDTFEFLENLNKIIKVIDKISNMHLLIRLRPQYELSKESLKDNLPNSDNYAITTTGSFEDDIINSDFLISYSSTTIEEALHFGKPVGLLGISNRYRHISESPSTEVSRKAVYHLSHKNLHNELLLIKSKHYNNNLNENEIHDYVWNDKVYTKQEFIFNQLLK